MRNLRYFFGTILIGYSIIFVTELKSTQNETKTRQKMLAQCHTHKNPMKSNKIHRNLMKSNEIQYNQKQNSFPKFFTHFLQKM